MKNLVLKAAVFSILLSCFFTRSSAQDAWHTTGERQMNNLNNLAKKMSDGYFERMIPLGYVESPVKSDKDNNLSFRNENTYLFYRFDFKPYPKPGRDSTHKADENYIIGKVFISERYLEMNYRRGFGGALSKKTDIDGVTYFCKLFYDRKYKDYRVNIYPDYPVNICTKNMHGNDTICYDWKKSGNIRAALDWHNLTIFSLIKIPDVYYSDFIYSKSIDSSVTNIFKQNIINIRSRNRILQLINITESNNCNDKGKFDEDCYAKNVKIKRKLNKKIQQLNYAKQIKCFSLGSGDARFEGLANKISLRFSKYALSDDFLENHTYDLYYHSFTSEEKTASAAPPKLHVKNDTTARLTENTWNRALIQSELPDDFSVNDLNVRNTNWYYLDNSHRVALKLGERARQVLEIAIKRDEDSLAKVIKAISFDSIASVQAIHLNRMLDDDKIKSDALKNRIASLNNLSSVPSIIELRLDRSRKLDLLSRTFDDSEMQAVNLLSYNIGSSSLSFPLFFVFPVIKKKLLSDVEHLNEIISNRETASIKLDLLTDQLQIITTNSKNVNERLDEIRTKKITEDSTKILFREKDLLKKSRNENITELEKLKPIKNDSSWIYFGRFPGKDRYIYSLCEILKEDPMMTQFWLKKISNKLPVRNDLPGHIKMDNYYYRGAVKAIFEVNKDQKFWPWKKGGIFLKNLINEDTCQLEDITYLDIKVIKSGDFDYLWLAIEF